MALAQDVIPAAIRLILGDPDLDVGWSAKTARWRDDDRHVLLSIVSRTRLGVDQRRYTASGADDVIERVYGVRRLAVQVRIETDDQDPAESASELADVIAAGFMRTDVLDLLDTAELGGPRPQAPITVDYRDEHGDTRSAVMLEVWFNAHRTHTGATIGRIKAVEVEGEILPDGPTIGPFTVEG